MQPPLPPQPQDGSRHGWGGSELLDFGIWFSLLDPLLLAAFSSASWLFCFVLLVDFCSSRSHDRPPKFHTAIESPVSWPLSSSTSCALAISHREDASWPYSTVLFGPPAYFRSWIPVTPEMQDMLSARRTVDTHKVNFCTYISSRFRTCMQLAKVDVWVFLDGGQLSNIQRASCVMCCNFSATHINWFGQLSCTRKVACEQVAISFQLAPNCLPWIYEYFHIQSFAVGNV
jgi:hypothetical protein